MLKKLVWKIQSDAVKFTFSPLLLLYFLCLPSFTIFTDFLQASTLIIKRMPFAIFQKIPKLTPILEYELNTTC